MGCPRVGNKHFAAYFDSIVPTSYRVVPSQGCCPASPNGMVRLLSYSISFFFNFRFIKKKKKKKKKEVWYTSDQNLDHVFCLTGEDPNCSDQLKVFQFSVIIVSIDNFSYSFNFEIILSNFFISAYADVIYPFNEFILFLYYNSAYLRLSGGMGFIWKI